MSFEGFWPNALDEILFAKIIQIAFGATSRAYPRINNRLKISSLVPGSVPVCNVPNKKGEARHIATKTNNQDPIIKRFILRS